MTFQEWKLWALAPNPLFAPLGAKTGFPCSEEFINLIESVCSKRKIWLIQQPVEIIDDWCKVAVTKSMRMDLSDFEDYLVNQPHKKFAIYCDVKLKKEDDLHVIRFAQE